MKIAVLIATTFLTAQAFAGTIIYHDYDAGLREINLQNACVTASEVRSIRPQRTCAELVAVPPRAGDPEYIGTDWVCKKWVNANFAYPREFMRPKCANYVDQIDGGVTCSKVVQVATFLPKTIPVTVITTNGNLAPGDLDNFPGVSKKHTFPSCK